MMIADSSFLISFFTPDDVNHHQAVQEAKKDSGNVFVVPDRILEETMTAMTYKRGVTFALDLLDKLQKNRQFIVRPTREEEIKATFSRIQLIQRKLSFIDYLVVELSVGLQTPVISFDRQLNALRRMLG
ncbi:PIN domain-containing protein [Candidatus Micrarchaeota archaeon]|nr:PIN domain-containing protein [Candidatus Micrarchaeota archaeon]